MGYLVNTVKVPPGIPDGAEVSVYRMHEVDADRRVGKKPSATALASATVTAAGKVTFGTEVLPDGEYALHATVNDQERYGALSWGLKRTESDRNYRRREAYWRADK